MGYSPRYHVASLAAVFFALAIGIVIGVGFGDNVASDATRDLESSLQSDLDAARSDADQLEGQLSRQRDFAQRAYPALVGGRLNNRRVGLISLGPLSSEVATDVEDALDPTGATLSAVAVVARPPDREALAAAIGGKTFRGLVRDDEVLTRYAQAVGRQILRGGGLLRQTSRQLFSRVSGQIGRIDSVIIYRAPLPAAPDGDGNEGEGAPADADSIAALEEGLVEGVASASAPSVGVERSDDDSSSIGLYDGNGLPSVDNIDQVAGRISAVFVLLGAEGSYGIRSSADQLLPDLLFGRRGAGRGGS